MLSLLKQIPKAHNEEFATLCEMVLKLWHHGRCIYYVNLQLIDAYKNDQQPTSHKYKHAMNNFMKY